MAPLTISAVRRERMIVKDELYQDESGFRSTIQWIGELLRTLGGQAAHLSAASEARLTPPFPIMSKRHVHGCLHGCVLFRRRGDGLVSDQVAWVYKRTT